MNPTKRKDTKEQYEKIVRLVEKAKKSAEKFVQKSINISSRPQAKYF